MHSVGRNERGEIDLFINATPRLDAKIPWALRLEQRLPRKGPAKFELHPDNDMPVIV